MESKDWSGFGYFSPDLEKIKQLVVCSKHQNTWEDTGNVVKVFFSIQSKKKNVRQWKETEFSTPFVVKAATSLLLNSLKFSWKALTSFMLPDYNCNSENFENISGQFGFLLLPRRFPCAVAVNKYLHRIPVFLEVFGCLDYINNCYIFFPYRGQNYLVIEDFQG